MGGRGILEAARQDFREECKLDELLLFRHLGRAGAWYLGGCKGDRLLWLAGRL